MTKREIFEQVLNTLRDNVPLGHPGVVDKENLMEVYDKVPDDQPHTTELISEPRRPTVHEIAMRLFATGNYDFDGAYDDAVTLYEVGTVWERNNKESKDNG